MIHRFICLSLLSLLSLPAQSAMMYDNRLLFEATLDMSVTDGYDRADYTRVPPTQFYNDAEMSAVFGETMYTATTFINSNYVPGRDTDGETYYCSGCNGSFLLDFTSTSVGTDMGVFGVGFDVFYGGQIVSNIIAFVTFGDGSTMNYDIPEANENVSPFWGLTDSLLIRSIHFGKEDGVPYLENELGKPTMALDNLTIGSMSDMPPVPLPAAFWLFASALAGLAGLRLRAASGTT